MKIFSLSHQLWQGVLFVKINIDTVAVMITTLEDTLKYISELEAENAALRKEVEHYKNRKVPGVRNMMK